MDWQHTPGPWLAEPTNSAEISYVAVSTVKGSNDSTVVIGQCAGPDRKANARLIAAAPELAEALAGLLGALSERGVVLERMAKPTPLIELLNSEAEAAFLNRARAALAKALSPNITDQGPDHQCEGGG